MQCGKFGCALRNNCSDFHKHGQIFNVMAALDYKSLSAQRVRLPVV